MKTVFFSSSTSIIKGAYNDVIKNREIEYCQYPYEVKRLQEYVFTAKFAKVIPYCLQKFVYNKFLKYEFIKKFNKDEEILFFFTCQYNLFFSSFFEYFIKFLKRRYKNAKFAFYYNDIIETCMPQYLNMVKNNFDLVLTFDKNEAEKYGIEFYGEVYSENEIDKTIEAPSSDVFFVGTDRGRLKRIIPLFKQISDCGLKAVFYVLQVDDRGKEYIEETLSGSKSEDGKIIYKNSYLVLNEYCPYQRTLAFISKCKCMAEITLKNQTAGTLRLCEATLYGKKLITNFNGVKEKAYYRKENILVYDEEAVSEGNCGDAIKEFINTPTVKVDYDFSPLKMIDYAKNKLFKEEE